MEASGSGGDDRLGGADGDGDTIEVDAHVGLVLHAITTQEHSYAVVLCAVSALRDVLSQPALPLTQKRMYVRTSVESGALAALLKELGMYYDRKDFVLAALELVGVILDANIHEEVAFPSTKDFLVTATQISRHAATHGLLDCAVQLLLVLERLVPLLTSRPSEYEPLISVVTKTMVAPFNHVEVVMNCFRCISEVVLTAAASFKLSDAAVNVVLKVLTAQMDKTDNDGQESATIALAALPVVLKLAKEGQAAYPQHGMSVRLVLTVLFGASRTRALAEAESRDIECFLGDALHFVVKKFCDEAPRDTTGGSRSHVSIVLTQNLSFALLWSSHAANFLELGGASSLLAVLEESLSTRNKHALTNAACALYHLCVTRQRASSNAIEEIQGLTRLVRCISASKEIASDELMDHLLAVVSTLTDHDNFPDAIIENGALDVLCAILKDRVMFPRSSLRTITLLSAIRGVECSRSPAARVLVEPLGDCRASLGINSTIQHDFVRAMLFSCAAFGEASTGATSAGLTKDLVRMMRSRLDDAPFLLELCQLLLRLMTDPGMRLDMVDNGIVQMVAKAMYLHERQSSELRQQLNTILTRTAHSVDVTRNASILQTLVLMWKQSLTPPSDVDTFVESLELNCYVNVALSRLKSLSGAVLSGNVKHNLCQILRNNIDDHATLKPQAFARIAVCCVYALQPLLDNDRNDEDVEDTAAQVHDQGAGPDVQSCVLFDTLRLVIESVAKIVDQVGDVGHQALIMCCRFVDRIVCTHRRAVDVAIKAGWLQTASKILMLSGWDVGVRVSAMSTTAAILIEDKSQGSCEKMVSEGLWSIFVASGNRLAAQGPRGADSSCLTLTLRNLELIAWSPQHRSNVLVLQCLSTLYRIVQSFVFEASSTIRDGILKSVSSILQGVCTEAFLDTLVQQAQHLSTSWDEKNMNAGSQDEHKQVCAALAIVLLVDERDGVLKKLSLRRPMCEIATQTLDHGFDSTHSGELRDAIATGMHLLSVPDRDRMLRASIASLADITSSGSETKRCMWWLYNVTKWSEAEISQATEALVEAITAAAEDCRFTTLEMLSSIFTHILTTSSIGRSIVQLLSSRARAALGVVSSSVLRQSVDPTDSKDGGLEWLQRVVHVLRLTVKIFDLHGGRSSHSRTLGFEPEALTSVCIQALGECMFKASCGAADASICKSMLFESLLVSSTTIFRASIATGADAARLLLQDPTIRHMLQLDSHHFGDNNAAHVAWCWSLATALVQEHGALYGERVFKLMPSPGWTMVEALTATAIDNGEDPGIWRSLSECVAVATELTGWGQMSIEEHLQSIVDTLERASAQTRQRSVSSPTLPDSVVQTSTTRLSLVVISLRFSSSSSRPPTSTLSCISKTCLTLAEMAAELFRNSTICSVDQFSKLAATLLMIAQLTIRSAYSDSVEAVVVGLYDSLVRPLPAEKNVVGAFFQLAATAFFQADSTPPSQHFLNGFPAILRTVLQDPTSFPMSGGNATDFHSAMSAIFDTLGKWSPDDSRLSNKRFLEQIAETCVVSTAVLDRFLRSIFDQQDGVDTMLEIAGTESAVSPIAEEIIFFLHRTASELRHKPVRAGQSEMKLILQLIRSNCSVSSSSSDTMLMTLSSLRTARSFRVIEAALVVLKAFSRVKRCAIACCEAGGLQVLYDLLSSSVQDETTSILTLEVCCYLTSYQENLVQRAVFPLLKLLFLITDAPDHGQAFVRLAFVVLDQCVTLASPQFTYSLVQMARRHLWKWRGSCSEDEIYQVVHKLYTLHIDQIRQRLESVNVIVCNIPTSNDRGRFELEEGMIRQALSRYHSVVQLPSLAIDPSTASYIDVRTSVKTHSELSSDYGALRNTLLQVRELVENQDFMSNQAFVDEIIPSVARVVILHASVTTDVVCVAMDIMSKLSFFLRVADLVALLDIRALLGSCFLHMRNSLPFTLHAASFCENIVVEARSDTDQAVLPMTKLLYAMMDQYPEDFDITQSCMSSLTGLLTTVSASVVIPMQNDPLFLLNRVFRNHAHDVSVLWNCGRCLQRLVPQSVKLEKASALETVSILLDVVRANLNHSFIVQLALTCIDSIERREPYQIRHVLLEMDAIGSLVDAMGIHLDDETIVATSMHLLLRMLSISSGGATQAESDVCAAAIESIVEKQGHLAILLVCRRQANSSTVCRLAVELLMTIVEIKEGEVSDLETKDQSDPPNAAIFQERVVKELLSYDILRFVFDIFDSFAFRPDSTALVALVLELLYDLLSTQPGRDAIQHAADLHKLREIIDVVWLEQRNVALLEAAIDCLVNAACSTKFTNVWCEFPPWLTTTAASLHEDQASSPSVEKIIGILTRLAIHPTIATEIASHSSHELLQILALVDEDSYLEGSLLLLLSQLCFDSANIPVLIMFDAIPTVIERIAAHVQHSDEEHLYTCLRFMMTMASHDNCIHSFQEKALHALLYSIIDNSKNSSRLQQLAHEIINRTTSFTVALNHKAPSIRHHVSIDAVRPPEPPNVTEVSSNDHDDRDSTNSSSTSSVHHELLWRGAAFRVRRDPKQQKKRERIMISLGESGEYLLFRNLSSDVHTVERVFVSQIEVLPNAEAVAMEEKSKVTGLSPRRKLSFGKSLSMPALVRVVSRADCIFHLMIKQELVSLEASSPRERREWEVALEWLVEHQQVAL